MPATLHDALQRRIVAVQTAKSGNLDEGIIRHNQQPLEEFSKVTQWQSVGSVPHDSKVPAGGWARKLCEEEYLFLLFFEGLNECVLRDSNVAVQKQNVLGYSQLLRLLASKLCTVAACGDSHRSAIHMIKTGAVHHGEASGEEGALSLRISQHCAAKWRPTKVGTHMQNVGESQFYTAS